MHKHLAENIKGGFNALRPGHPAQDDNGHGTHVAGIVAAANNSIGVAGVGPAIHLYAVKVLSRSGSGYLSDLVEGLQWCVANGIQVANMSLGASADNQTFHDAITAAYQAGVTQVAAAGNEGAGVSYPAKYPETIAVSAVGQSANGTIYFASFSNFGPEVDMAAPGVLINSTYKGGVYAVLNGTSMAAPHVAGAVALKLLQQPGLSPDQVRTALMGSAEPLPNFNASQQGAGLVNALRLVQP